ncbi:hypothetical protein BDY19DRAFT_878091, partial [Irpex rosettiformis]
GRLPTDATLWHGLRHKDISRNIADFLWHTTHNSPRVGKYWTHIPTYEQRATCELCNVEDSIEHILIECDAPENKVIWSLVKKGW